MSAIYSLRDIEVCQESGFKLSIQRLDLEAGKIYALVGPNGAGKSTLLSTLALLNMPRRGEIVLDGFPVLSQKSRLKHHRRQVTLVEQSPYLFDRSVYDNLAFGLKVRGLERDEAEALIVEALDSVGLAGFEMRNAKQLSGGEVQRVALARALVLQPKVLLLDEPTSNIDWESLQVFEKLVSALVEQGVTVVFSTHDALRPRRLGAELICLQDGKILPSQGADSVGETTCEWEKVYG